MHQVCVLAFPKVRLTAHVFLSLNDETVCLSLPLLDENGGQFKSEATRLLSLPPPDCKYVVIEGAASVGPDIEVPAVLLHFAYNAFRTRAAVGSETPHGDS